MIINMFQERNSLEPPINSQLTGQLPNNSFKTFKTSEYESKIYELSNQVKVLRERLLEIEEGKNSSGQQLQESRDNREEMYRAIELLREDNQALKKQNQMLRERVNALEAAIGRKQMEEQMRQSNKDLISMRSARSLRGSRTPREGSQVLGAFTAKNSLVASSHKSVTTNLLRELLAECNEPSQSTARTEKQVQKDEFYEFKNTEDCFQPFFSNLTREHRLRLKKCLVKQKDLLYIGNHLEVGVIAPYKPSKNDPPQEIRLVLVITNLTPAAVTNICFEFIHGNDVSLVRKSQHTLREVLCSKNKTLFPEPLLNNDQIKEEVKVTVNSIDFRCVKATLTYEVSGNKHSQLLILPLSKLKLCKQLPFSAPPPETARLERVFQHEKKVLPDLKKLKSIFGSVYEGKQKNGSFRYSWKTLFLGKTFWLEVSAVEEQIAVCVLHNSQGPLAQKLLGELVFLLQKL